MSEKSEKIKRLAQESQADGSDGFFADAYRTISTALASAVSGDPEIRQSLGPQELTPQNLSTSERIKYLADNADLPADATVETPGTAFGSGFAETIPFAVGLGVMSQVIPPARAASGGYRILSAVQNAANRYGQIFNKRPGSLITGEAVSGGVGGATGFTLENAFPDLPGARLIGEIAGGSAADLGPTVIRMLPSAQIFDLLKNKFSGSAAEQRAAQLLQIGDREAAARMLRQGQDLSPGAEITSATLTGQPIYSRLEQSVIKAAQDGEISERLAQQIQNTNNAIADDLNFGGASQEGLQDLFENQINLYSSLLDARMQVAANRANVSISRLQPQNVREGIEPIVRDYLSRALSEARQFENQLYDAIDQQAVVPINISNVAYRQVNDSLPEAQKGNMPNAAKYLNPKSSSYIGAVTEGGRKKITNQNSIFELRGVQSELRAEARNARSGDAPNFQRARIADELADSITEDIANVYVDSNEANPVATAIAFSRELNERFSRGDVARILRRERTGAESIDPSMTLSATLGAGPRVNRVAYDDILQSVSGNPEVQSAMEDFLRFNFFRGNEFNPRSAQNFLVSNSDLMNRMPALKREVQDAIRTGNSADLARIRSQGGTAFLDPRINKSIIYTNKGPRSAFNSVLSARRPASEMRSLMKMASRDETGEALEGLKTSFTKYLFDESQARATLPDGQKTNIISSDKFSSLVNDPKVKQAIMTLYSKEERARIERAARTSQMLARQMQTREGTELLAKQNTNMLQRMLLRVTGATLGRRLQTGTLQAPQAGANILESVARGGVLDADKKLLEDAIFDPDLFTALLEKPTEGAISGKSQRALRAWAAQTLATYGNEAEDEQANQAVPQ